MASRERKTTESLEQYRRNLSSEEWATRLKMKGRLVYNSGNRKPARVVRRAHVDSTISPTDRYYV